MAKDLGRQLHDNLADDGDVRGDGVRDNDHGDGDCRGNVHGDGVRGYDCDYLNDGQCCGCQTGLPSPLGWPRCR